MMRIPVLALSLATLTPSAGADLGADGVTIPHVQGVDEAKLAISFFQDAKANVCRDPFSLRSLRPLRLNVDLVYL